MTNLPTLDDLKTQAKSLRAALERAGSTISHSQSLELLAQQLGYRDWNTLFARIGNRPPETRYQIGQFVNGHYLGHPFRARIRAVRERADGWFQLDLKFDNPIDVVESDRFSAFRSYVNCAVDADGRTFEKTSNGQPHVVLAR